MQSHSLDMTTSGRSGRLIWRLGAGIWLGGLVFFSLVVTPVAFRVLPTTAIAKFLIAMFPTYYAFEVWVGGVALIGLIWALVRGKMARGWWVLLLTLAAWALVLWADHVLGLMNHLTSTSAAFHRLHQESVTADGLVGVFLIVSLVLDSWR